MKNDDPLASIFRNLPADELDALFANGVGPLPAGDYVAELVSGKLGQSRGGTRRYELRAKIVEGEHAGKMIFDDWYLTTAAMWKSGPLLKALGIDNPEKLRRELPAGLLARVKLAIEDYDGVARNKIKTLTVIGRRPAAEAAADPFAPAVEGQSDGGSPPAALPGDAYEHPAETSLPAGDAAFDFPPVTDGPYGRGERR